MTRLIVACDFNGVIHDHRDRVKGSCCADDPDIPGAIDWLKATSEKFDIVLVSASFARAEFVSSAKVWLAAKGIPREWLVPVYPGRNRITLTPFKPPCLLFVDDRAFFFQGRFPTVKEIETFKPWNR
jgi:hypothetical protein